MNNTVLISIIAFLKKLKIYSSILFIILFANIKYLNAQDSSFKKLDSMAINKTNSKNLNILYNLSEADLRKELSGRYEGLLEFHGCCNSTGYQDGVVYFDLTSDIIIFIYDGVTKSDYYYKEGKIFSETEFSEDNSEIGWFEKLNDSWVFWQIFQGYQYDDGTLTKPDYVTKKEDIDFCRSEINAYLNDENDMKLYWEKLKNAIINSEENILSDLVNFPLTDETSFCKRNNLKNQINNSKEFIYRLQLELEKMETSSEDFFIQFTYSKRMKNQQYLSGKYFLWGYFSFIFEKINGQYKIVRLFDFD